MSLSAQATWLDEPSSPGVRLPHHLIIADAAAAPSVPLAIQNLTDPLLQARAVEVWNAACRLVAAMDVLFEWFINLRAVGGKQDSEGPDPGIYSRCEDAAGRFIHTLYVAGVRAEPFDRLSEDQILLSSPRCRRGQLVVLVSGGIPRRNSRSSTSRPDGKTTRSCGHDGTGRVTGATTACTSVPVRINCGVPSIRTRRSLTSTPVHQLPEPAMPDSPSSGASHSPLPLLVELPPADGPVQPARPPYTLGELIAVLDGIDQNREFRLLNYQEQFRRNPGQRHDEPDLRSCTVMETRGNSDAGYRSYRVALRLEHGEAGITAAKVRRLRADLPAATLATTTRPDQLTLDQAADILEGVRRVSLRGTRGGQDASPRPCYPRHDHVGWVEEVIRVTGSSCKVISGTTPTACPTRTGASAVVARPAERAIRRLSPLPAGTTIHWVGHETGFETGGRCHRTVVRTAPFDHHWWSTVAPTDSNKLRRDWAGGTGRDAQSRC